MPLCDRRGHPLGFVVLVCPCQQVTHVNHKETVKGAKMTDAKGITATIIGVVTLAAFGASSYYLARHIGAEQLQWDRLVYIFGGIEAVAFAAAGYFFGKEVNRARAESAEGKAEKAENASREDHEKRSEMQGKFSSLVTYIETQGPRKLRLSVPGENIRFAYPPRETLSRSEAASEGEPGVEADDQWAALTRFARSL